jgi:FkbM family methyltransferase
MVNALRAITPDLLKTLYRKSRIAIRTVTHAFDPTMSCRVRDKVIRLGVSSELERYRAESYSSKEPETLDWLEENLKDGDVFMDVGANIGLYSLYAATLRSHAQIYAFEPEAHNFFRLCRNILLNGATNITPCNFPLSDCETFDLFYVGDRQAGAALHSFGRLSEFRRGPECVLLRQGAIAVTLDALVGRYGLPQPALLKVDVDGLEEKILNGAEAVLKSARLRTILIEVTGKNDAGSAWPEQKLSPLGYALTRKSDWIAELNGLRSQNYILSRA